MKKYAGMAHFDTAEKPETAFAEIQVQRMSRLRRLIRKPTATAIPTDFSGLAE